MRTGLSAQTCSTGATISGRHVCWPSVRSSTQPPVYNGLSRGGRLAVEPADLWLALPTHRQRLGLHARRLQVQSAIAEPPAALLEQESFPRGAQWQVRLLDWLLHFWHAASSKARRLS